uniref:Armadillo-type fold,Armadillo-like helical n=1 Tax=Strongyloides stercoralis TaxID=6248 RepID=A0A0K0E3B3_STRER
MNSPTLSQATTSINSTVEDSIIHLLNSIRYEVERNKYPTELDYEKFKNIHDTLEKLINEEHNSIKKRKFMAFLPIINNFRLQTLVLRKCIKSCEGIQVDQYLNQFETKIAMIHNESFDEMNRKILIILGGVDVIAEIFVLDVKVFGINSSSINNSIRQLIATVLTNMTFGNKDIKRKLCSHSNFIHTVTKIIEESQSLSLVYASLIRNLSWKADQEMTEILSETVSALCKSALRAYVCKDFKRLSSSLQALWNLAGNSMDNRRTICNDQSFMDLLINLLTITPQQATLLESASGILSYASIYISKNNAVLSSSKKIKTIQYLFNLLKESSFTIISNSLNSLYHLILQDVEMQHRILNNQNCMFLLNRLRNSNREDIRNVVKKLLNEVYNNSPLSFDCHLPKSTYASHHSYMSRDNEMIASCNHRLYESQYSDNGRLLPLRSTLLPAPVPVFSSPRGNIMFKSQNDCYMEYNGFKDPNKFNLQSISSRSNSLPRQYNDRNNGINNDLVKPTISSTPIEKLDVKMNTLQVNPSINTEPIEQLNDSGESENRLSDSMRCTRSSVVSFGTDIQNQSGWESVVSTTENSAPTSPISMRDIPDSPTQCMKLKPPIEYKMLLNNQGPSSLTPLANHQPPINSNIKIDSIENELEGGGIIKNFRNIDKSSNSNSDSDGEQQNNTNETFKGYSSGNSHLDIDDDLKIQSGSFLSKNNTELLETSIEAFIPPPCASSSFTELAKYDTLLSQVINETIPKPSNVNEQLFINNINPLIKNNTINGNSHFYGEENRSGGIFNVKGGVSNGICQELTKDQESGEDDFNLCASNFLENSAHSIEETRSCSSKNGNCSTDASKVFSIDSFVNKITDNTFEFDDEDDDDDGDDNDDDDDDNDNLNFCTDDINTLPYDIEEYSEKDNNDIIIDCSKLTKKSTPSTVEKQKCTKGSLIPTISKPKSNKKKEVSKGIKPFMNKSNLSPSAHISPFNYKKNEEKGMEGQIIEKKKTGMIVTSV